MLVDRAALHLFQPHVRAWSWRQKLRNPLAGLRFFRRTSDSGLNLAARHWPHLLCWSWKLGFNATGLPAKWWIWHFSRRALCLAGWPLHFFADRHNTGGEVSLAIWRVGQLRFTWQAYGPAPSGSHESDCCTYVASRITEDRSDG